MTRWRSLGVELAFDPSGRPELGELVEHLDGAQLARCFPRDPDGRLPLDVAVLLVQVGDALPHQRARWLVAASPARRADAQVITLLVRDEIARNQVHRWDDARWLWDARAATTPELERWGTTLAAVRTPIGELDAGRPEHRAAIAVHHVVAGRWREALAVCGVRCAIDELPYAQCNGGRGIVPEAWDAGLAAGMRDLAPWRLHALAGPHEIKLFDLPHQTTSRKYAVMLVLDGGPCLRLGLTGSNVRAAALAWRWPPDLAIALRGEPPPIVPPKVRSSGTRVAEELFAEIVAQPDDDEPRHVLADLLTTRGDPRGELIALQLAVLPEPRRFTMRGDLLDVPEPGARAAQAGKVAKRIRELIATHARGWLGPLGPLVTSATYERGFLATCTLGGPQTPFDAWAGAVAPRGLAELGCVRELALADAFPLDLARELLAKLPRVDRLSIPASLAPALARAYRVVELRLADAAGLAVLDGLVAPRELRIRLPDMAFWGPGPTCADRRATLPVAIERYVVATGRVGVAFTRDARGDLTIADAAVAVPRWGTTLNGFLRNTIARITALTVHGELGAAEAAIRQWCADRQIPLRLE